MSAFIYQWIDLIWLPIGWFAVHKRHRWYILAFLVTCLVTFRTQLELMNGIGYPTGILSLMNSPLHTRGMIIYSIIFTLFLLLAHYSPGTRGVVFLAASISIYIFAFCVSMVVMLL